MASKPSINLPEIAIVGRPNVGKSTLFNRLIGWRKAIEFKEAGTTRDCLYELISWRKKNFWLIDTGGLSFDHKDEWSAAIEAQVDKVIGRASVCLFVVDGQSSITTLDERIAENLRKLSKHVVVVVNKIDSDKHLAHVSEFYKFGFGNPYPVSALHNRGIDELFSELTREFEVGEDSELKETVRFTLIGEPNSGKSTLFNALTGEYRALVSPVAGTTRDFVEEWIKIDNFAVCLTDTGGLKRNRNFKTVPAYLSAIRSRHIIQKSDIVFLLMDAPRGPQRDTRMIFELAFESKKPCILLVTKWDLSKNVPQADYTKAIHREFHFLKSVPIFYISSLGKRNLKAPFTFGVELYKKMNQPVDPEKLMSFFKRMSTHPLFSTCGLVKLEQVSMSPLIFRLSMKRRNSLTEDRKKAFINQIRDAFHFEGIPITLKLN
jgi:GTP-binding protein